MLYATGKWVCDIEVTKLAEVFIVAIILVYVIR